MYFVYLKTAGELRGVALGSDKDTFLQMFFVYLKKKARNQDTYFPGDAAGGLCGVALDIRKYAPHRGAYYFFRFCMA